MPSARLMSGRTSTRVARAPAGHGPSEYVAWPVVVTHLVTCWMRGAGPCRDTDVLGEGGTVAGATASGLRGAGEPCRASVRALDAKVSHPCDQARPTSAAASKSAKSRTPFEDFAGRRPRSQASRGSRRPFISESKGSLGCMVMECPRLSGSATADDQAQGRTFVKFFMVAWREAGETSAG